MVKKKRNDYSPTSWRIDGIKLLKFEFSNIPLLGSEILTTFNTPTSLPLKKAERTLSGSKPPATEIKTSNF